MFSSHIMHQCKVNMKDEEGKRSHQQYWKGKRYLSLQKSHVSEVLSELNVL